MPEIQLNIILNGTPKPTKSSLHLFSAYKRYLSNAVRNMRSVYYENHTTHKHNLDKMPSTLTLRSLN